MLKAIGPDRRILDSPPLTGDAAVIVSSGFAGRSRNHSNQKIVQTVPMAPSMRNEFRQGHLASIQASKGSEMAALMREPENRTPFALPRSPGGSQLYIARAPPRNTPASAIPRAMRTTRSDVKLQANPVRIAITLHNPTTTVRPARGPTLSISHPPGISLMA